MTDAAAAVVFDEHKQNYLLVKRRDVPIWVLPGGGIDPGEAPDEAAVREVWEESGLNVRVVRKVAVYTPTGRLTAETHLFECAVTGGQLQTSDESLDVGFFPIDTYPAPVFDIHLRWLRDTCQNHPDVIVKPIEGLAWRDVVRMMVFHPVLSGRFLLTKIGLRWNTGATRH